MPFPELNLSLGLTDNDGSVFMQEAAKAKLLYVPILLYKSIPLV